MENFDSKKKLRHHSRALIATIILSVLSCHSKTSAAAPLKINDVEEGLSPLVQVSGSPAQSSLAERMKYYHVPGVSVAVVRNGRILWSKAYGYLENGKDETVTEQTMFESASISKPLTAMITMTQIRKGLLDLNSPVNTWLKSWQVPPSTYIASSPTIKQIMSHTAGFNGESVSGYFLREPQPTLLQILNGHPPANTQPVRVVATPGDKYQYSGGGFLVLQQALIDTSKLPFETLADTQLLQKLKMQHSTFAQLPVDGYPSKIATGHAWNGAPMPARQYPELTVAGLRTTPTDLAKIIIEVQQANKAKGKVLTADEVAQILTVQHTKPSMGLSFFVDGEGAEKRFYHDGWNYGFTCRLVGYVGGDGAVVMTNGDSGALMIEILESMSRVYGWPSKPRAQRKSELISLGTAKAVEGNYDWGPGMQAEILRDQCRLYLRVFHVNSEEMDPFPPTELYAKSATEFFTFFPSMNIQIETDKSNIVSAITRRSDGNDLRAPRLPAASNKQ